jgi:Ca-activated chloride channel homolog
LKPEFFFCSIPGLLKVFLIGSIGFCLHFNSIAQTRQQKVAEKTRLLFLLDASGSMLDPWGRNQTKLSVAKSILVKIVDSLRQNTKIELALRLYGHRFPPGVNNCTDTELVVPFKVKNHQLIIDRINGISPRGVTPISYSLEQSANDFPDQTGYRNLIILITDGIESCGGDPCAMSIALQRKGVFLQPYIIGLGLTAEKSLECAGTYLNAETPGKFHEALNLALERSFAKTTVSVLLQGANQKPETNINVTFQNAYTGFPMYEFVNYLDANRKPDTVEVDPMVRYDLVVNTIPPIIKAGTEIRLGEHTTLTIPVVQGNLLILQEENKKQNLQCIIREKGRNEILHTQSINETVRYLAGNYEVEALTLPRRKYAVTIGPDKTATLLLPQPGIVNFNTIGTGYGSIYEVGTDGRESWVCNLNNLKSVFSLTILPGKYKIVFRVKHSPGSKYTAYKIFEVTSARTHQINVFE